MKDSEYREKLARKLSRKGKELLRRGRANYANELFSIADSIGAGANPDEVLDCSEDHAYDFHQYLRRVFEMVQRRILR